MYIQFYTALPPVHNFFINPNPITIFRYSFIFHISVFNFISICLCGIKSNPPHPLWEAFCVSETHGLFSGENLETPLFTPGSQIH